MGFFFLLSGIVFLLYYITIIIYAGWRASFSWLWLAGGIIFIGVYALLEYKKHHALSIKLPNWAGISLITFIVAILLIFGIIEGFIIGGMSQETTETVDYTVVLGAQVIGSVPSKALRHRLDAAYAYYQEHPDTILILSGGQGTGENISEAQAMYDYLYERGIPASHMLQENRSTNTAENLEFSIALMQGENPSAAVVTNNFHIYRAVSIGRKQGLTQISGIPAPGDPILQINYMVRECFGVIKDKLAGNM